MTEQQIAAMRQDTLKQMLWYDPETGLFRWRHERNNGKIKPWTVAGSPDNKGHIKIQIGKQMHRAHRLAWFYMTGSFPTQQIDHKNLVKSDNRWCNLREANAKQNQWNTGLRADNKSGVKGVHFCKTWKRWVASVKVNGVRHHVGRFATIEEAAKAVIEFRKEHHGEYAN